MSARPWYVCDVDEGVLRIAPTRREAVDWARTHTGAPLLERFAYGPGYYGYVSGFPGEESATDVVIVREDRLAAYGLSDEHRAAGPRFPHPDKPHEERA